MALKSRPILDMNAFNAASDGCCDPLLDRRLKNCGAASVLFYRRPIEMVRAQGVWMEAADGSQYLDFYNNVSSVGHCHPQVVSAISAQAAQLNTNTRYLDRRVESYLERLKATLPTELSNVVMCCTGSEANDLALRIAIKATGRSGVIVTETAYHGNTLAVMEISPASYKQGEPSEHVHTIPAPSRVAYGNDIEVGFAQAVERAAQTLKRRGHPPAVFICDSIFSSDGVFTNPTKFLAGAVAAARNAGSLYIADEVQPGFARTGDTFWGFERHGVIPDIVTMGKPMGNGFPMAALVTHPELLAIFCRDVGYFNTFAGNALAAAAGMAVLDVIESEGLQQNATRVGAHLLARLGKIVTDDPRVVEVRGAGLFLGIDLCQPDDPGSPNPALAAELINALRDRHVLIGATGCYGQTLKVRPPLCLTTTEADLFVDALSDSLAVT